MEQLVECVPNFSEGRNPSVIAGIREAIEAVGGGVRVLDVDSGAKTHRTVITFVGPPAAVEEAAWQAAKRAAELIDMRTHKGEHPRLGATDVLPFVPVRGVTMEECVEMARRVGRRLGEELGIPVFLYEEAATRPERRNLANIRAGEYEGLADKLRDPAWAPDFGPAVFHPKAGATIVGAREFLIAFNINLNTTDRRYANDLAYALRERGRWKRVGKVEPFYYKGRVVYFPQDGTFPCGPCDYVASSFQELEAHYAQVHGGDLRRRYEELGIDPRHPSGPVFTDGLFRHVKAIGWVIDEYRRAQISMNLTNFRITPPHLVLEAAREEARKRGIVVTGSEIVGLIPFEAMREAGRYYRRRMMKSPGIPVSDLVETAVQSMGLRDVAPFEPRDKVLGLPVPHGPLVLRPTFDFVDEVSRDTPAPGGGSVAALAGALGAALGSMVANLCIGKAEYDHRFEELSTLAEEAQEVKDGLVRLVDDDTRAFDAVLEAMRLPQDTDEDRRRRAEAVQDGYRKATAVPMTTVELCLRALEVCRRAAIAAPREMISDVGVGALLARAGLCGAAYNVRINLRQLQDREFAELTRTRLQDFLAKGEKLAAEVQMLVETALEAPPATPGAKGEP